MPSAPEAAPYSGATRIIFIVGDPVAQVKAPAGLTRWFRQRGHDLCVVPAHVAPEHFADFLATAQRMRNVDGVIVTIPHKFAAYAACRAVDATAARVGSVNLLRRHPDDGWFGAMTDGRGCIIGLRDRGFDVRGKRALLIGAGGAGRAVADALVQAGLGALRICDVDSARAEDARASLAQHSRFHAEIGAADATGIDLIVNATFLGTAPTDAVPIAPETIAPTSVVADLACGPNGCTELVRQSAARGCPTMTGDELFEAMCGMLGEFFLSRSLPHDVHHVVNRSADSHVAHPQVPPADRLRALLNGYQATQAIHAAAMIGVPDCLDSTTPRTVAEVAAATESHAPSLYRLLRALAALGVLSEHEGKGFTLTPMGACLRADATPSLGPWARFLAEPSRWSVWGHLTESVRTGRHAFPAVHGMDCWEYRRQHPQASALFHAAMAGNSTHIDAEVVAACDLTGRRHLGDIGGGHGSLLASFLKKYPALHGTLLDQAEVIRNADSYLHAAGVRDRCRLVGDDFFHTVPPDCDTLMLKFILHDWDDERARLLLQTCRTAVAPGAKLFVAEYVIGPPNTGLHIKMSDLSMFLVTGGQERTESEFATLLHSAGFRYERMMPTAGLLSVLVAEAV